MKRILLQGAGGVAGIGMTRCLQAYYDVFGVDDNEWSKKLMLAIDDDGGDYDLIIPIADSLVAIAPRHVRKILPGKKEIALCQDKGRCAKVLGDLAPKTYWIRDTRGAGGKGAQMKSEYLPGENYSCEVIFNDGEFLGSFVKHRLSYSVVGVDLPLDKRGSSMVSRCEDQNEIVVRSLTALDRIGGTPHGAYGIDFKGNEEGEPLITEINPGRFLTASYVYFYTTGYNLPRKLYSSYFGEDYELPEYPAGTGIIRAVDSHPWVGKI